MLILIAYRCLHPSGVWEGSWLHTVLKIPSCHSNVGINCENLFSDVLHQPFLCSSTPLSPFCTNIPPGNEITRLDSLSAFEFTSTWVNKPFILSNTVDKWPVCSAWLWPSFRERYGAVTFAAEAVNWTLDSYLKYADNNLDESPLYLFDQSFVQKMELIVGKNGDYWAPECFGEDFFSVLNDQRPDRM